MNFLAHFHLARDEPGLLVGALLGDYVKGPLRGEYSQEIETGIFLHRRIDAHSDQFVQAQNLHRLFPSSYRRYLGIMLDLYFDYLLTHSWRDYERRSLSDFAKTTNDILHRHSDTFPARCQQFFQRMTEHRLLEAYGEADTQKAILQRLSQRLPSPNPLSECWAEVDAQRAILQPAFVQLYKELQEISRQLKPLPNEQP